ncbi:hypothetical protein ACEYYH_08360 [Microbacterium trichothecenolyticum]|uniref:hypothetical protein n=1 Tax=Microbacterium trichothecenolyticum TaxID=69370 RepID=UPI0035BE7DF6
MRITYRIIAFVICGLVALQAASHAWASAGLGVYLAEGGVVDGTAVEGPPPFPEVTGFIIHGMNGMFVIPALALILLIISFFAKVPHGVVYAVVVFGLVVLQVTLGLLGHGVAFLGFLHGMNALLLFTAALLAGLNAKRRAVEPAGAVSVPSTTGATA